MSHLINFLLCIIELLSSFFHSLSLSHAHTHTHSLSYHIHMHSRAHTHSSSHLFMHITHACTRAYYTMLKHALPYTHALSATRREKKWQNKHKRRTYPAYSIPSAGPFQLSTNWANWEGDFPLIHLRPRLSVSFFHLPLDLGSSDIVPRKFVSRCPRFKSFQINLQILGGG